MELWSNITRVVLETALTIFCACIVLAFWFAGSLTWQVWLFAVLSANANQMHKWTHRTRKENGPVITFLQDILILQTAKHHLIHHKDPKNSHYCTMTNCLNPVLDFIHFWGAIEWLLAHTVGLHRRPDTSLRTAGSAPEWLKEVIPPRPTFSLLDDCVECAVLTDPAS